MQPGQGQLTSSKAGGDRRNLDEGKKTGGVQTPGPTNQALGDGAGAYTRTNTRGTMAKEPRGWQWVQTPGPAHKEPRPRNIEERRGGRQTQGTTQKEPRPRNLDENKGRDTRTNTRGTKAKEPR